MAGTSVAPALADVLPLRATRGRRNGAALVFWLFVLGNAGGLVWIWAAGGADRLGYHWHSLDGALVGAGRLTALLAGFLALVQVLLLARLPFLERAAGFDRLTRWHRLNGYGVIGLVLAHVVLSVWG